MIYHDITYYIPMIWVTPVSCRPETSCSWLPPSSLLQRLLPLDLPTWSQPADGDHGVTLEICWLYWDNDQKNHVKGPPKKKKKMQPTNVNAHTYVNGTYVETHGYMQSRRTLFCNSLFEQSCTYFPCYQSAVWSGKCRVWSVEWKVWSEECGV